MFVWHLTMKVVAMATSHDAWALLIIAVLSVGPVLVTLYVEARQSKADSAAEQHGTAPALDR
jgi:pyruvate/2-oxoglutarate/acetoin dehydrogenase E1 component